MSPSLPRIVAGEVSFIFPVPQLELVVIVSHTNIALDFFIPPSKPLRSSRRLSMVVRMDAPIPEWVYVGLILIYYILFWVLSVPLTGVLVRFRANYNPKGLQITDVEEVEQGSVEPPVVGPVVKSYFGMFARVYRLEGISGLFKGFMPNLIFRIVLGPTPLGYGNYRLTLLEFRASTIAFILTLVLLSVPAMTIIYRAMTVTSKLSPFRPLAGLRALLTSHERTNPLNLYKNPGLFLAWTLHISLFSSFFTGARAEAFATLGELIRLKITGPEGHGHPITRLDNPVEFWVLMGAILIVGLLLLPPLEVVLVRMSLQRNNGPAATEPLVENSDEPPCQSDVVLGGDEDVIVTHPDTDPYVGLIDCIKRIMKEEGWMTLYRGWWITLVFGGFQSSLL